MVTKQSSLIIITGPTASGKTKLAVSVAHQLNGEIICADSRQVYKGMDIGTGKDLSEYNFQGRQIPYHLIDICEAGEKYNLFEYQKDFAKAYRDIVSRGKVPVVCGGTGLYIEAVLKDFKQTLVPVNEALRKSLESREKNELENHLREINTQKLNFDVSTKKRLIRAIEISQYLERNAIEETTAPQIDYHIFCLKPPREVVVERIQNRLESRLQQGLIEEVERLIGEGVGKETLKYYGLEYKFVTQYLDGDYSYDEMVGKLNIAIRQYAKRQMTWFRRMERSGFAIHWIDGRLSIDEQASVVMESI